MTETKKSANPVVRLALILFLISAVTAGILGLVNMVTKDRIAEQLAASTKAAYNEVLPYDGEYVAVEFDSDNEDFKTVKSVSKAGDEGYVVELSFSGAQSTITAAVGVDANGTVTGVSIIKHGETSGLGARATESSFRDQYIGATAGVALTKNGGEIQAISGATITSTAVTKAVNTAINVVASLG